MQFPKSLSSIASVAEGARSEGLAKSLPWLVSAALVVLLAWQLVQLAWTVLGSKKGVAAPSGPVAALPAPSAPPIDINTIINAHLFGAAAAPGVGETDPNAVAASQMSLVLVGTIAASDPEKGYAIIGENATSAKVYAVGKTITGGTKLHSVYPDRAILDRGGRLEALLLPKQFQGGGLNPPPGMAGGAQGSIGDRLRQLATENPAAITEILRPQPVFANGQQRGYRVYPGRNRQQFTRLGLMPGDLVTAVNGTPLDDPARGMDILQTMNSATEVTVTIERNGQSTQVSINNAQVAAEAAAAAASLPETIPVTEVPGASADDPSE